MMAALVLRVSRAGRGGRNTGGAVLAHLGVREAGGLQRIARTLGVGGVVENCDQCVLHGVFSRGPGL